MFTFALNYSFANINKLCKQTLALRLSFVRLEDDWSFGYTEPKLYVLSESTVLFRTHKWAWLAQGSWWAPGGGGLFFGHR